MIKPSGLRIMMCAASVFCLTACDTMKTEIASNGGLVGSIADHALPAPTKDMQLYRATLAFAIVSRAGGMNLKDSDEIKAFNTYMILVDDDLRNLRKHLSSGISCNSLAIDEFYCAEMFESSLPKLEEHLLKLSAIGLPSEDFRDVVNDVKGGNITSAAGSIIKMAGSTARAAHGGASVYRSSQEILTLVSGCSVAGAVSPGVPTAFECMHGSKRRETFSALQTKLNAGTVSGPYNTLYNVVQEACLDMRVRTAKSDANGVWDYEIKCNFAFGGEPHNRYKPG